MNGITFGTEGPMMSGTWYNPKTGDAFTVRDSFFEDNEYVVTTTDGRYLKYNQLQNYVQTDMKLEELKRTKHEKSNKREDLPPEVAGILEAIDPNDPYAGMMSPEDLMIGNLKPVNLGNIYANPVTQSTSDYIAHGKGQSMNEAIIEKALKNAPKPEIKVDIFWDVYPEKQIEMLKDVMEISEDEIINWYLDNIDMTEVVDALNKAIRNRILYKEYEVLQNKIKELVPTIQDMTSVQSLNEKEDKPKKSRKTTK